MQEDEDEFTPDAEEEPEDDFEEDVIESSQSGESEPDEDNSDLEPEDRLSLKTVENRPKHGTTAAKGTGQQALDVYHVPQDRIKVPIHITSRGGTTTKPNSFTPLRTRGVGEFTKIGGQEVRLKDLYGTKNEDLMPILATRDHWVSQKTLPIKKPSTVRRSFFDRPETREMETRTTQGWYADAGRGIFANAQKGRTLIAEKREIYMSNDGPDSLNVLLGPITTPQVYTLKQGSYVNIAEPFADKRNRRGWLFNLGSRIQDAQWAVNEEGDTQYLAVAVEQNATGSQPKSLENPKALAFSAADPFSGSIQIWAFKADADACLDSSQQPHLQVVICTDWGAPKQFRWCPISTSDRASQADDDSDVHIGLLAGFWSDGRVRVLDVSYPRLFTTTSDTHYLHISQAAFEVSFPQTVPSCLRWLSGTSLAVCTAMGTLAIWTLNRPDTFTSKSSTNSPRPWFYKQISETFIITLSSGWPSQPHLISISTADGFSRMYDLRSPSADSTASIRGRTLCISQDWHEQTQSFIAPDEHFMLKHNPIRRYYHNLYSMRAPATITRVASSPVQPAILMGGADGRIETSNPIGRITNYKIVPWQQTWFAHEWRGPVETLVTKPPGKDVEMGEVEPVQEPSAPEGDNTDANNILAAFLSQPLARITEGYKAYQPGIQHSVLSKKVANPEVGKGITIFEEGSAITALAWNPSLKFGTWAVAGMGDGLLRVEDVGV